MSDENLDSGDLSPVAAEVNRLLKFHLSPIDNRLNRVETRIVGDPLATPPIKGLADEVEENSRCRRWQSRVIAFILTAPGGAGVVYAILRALGK